MTRRIALAPQNLVALAFDASVAICAWSMSFMARYQFSASAEDSSLMLVTLPLVVAIELACFVGFGLYRGIWRYASMYDVKRIFTAVGVSAMLVPITLLLWRHGLGVPRVLYFVNPLILILFMGGGRIFYRWFKEHRQFSEVRRQGRPVLLMGAGDAARRLLLELEHSASWRVIGLLDESGAKVGREIAGYLVMGTWDDVASISQRTSSRHVIFAVADEGNALSRRKALDLCEKAGLELMVVPDLEQMFKSPNRTAEIRHIELQDLLGRDQVQLDSSGLLRQLGGKVLMVTGAGGSIGSELCRQIARFAPQALVLYELNEFGLYQVVEDLQRLHPEIKLWPVVGDIKDRQRLNETFERFLPRIVFHAAAYKHVPLVEELNAWQAVRNNALGTRIVAETAARHKVERLVFVSTDKAVNPTNVMGATKRVAELMLQLDHQRVGLPVVIVRFGNVLGSSGSVIPKFKEQIARGGPITITHPEITRYFMSVTEAAQLVLQAGLMGSGGEIFVLDMGQPVRILDMARDMLRLSGVSEDSIGIEFTGLRPGEKLYEELLAADESTLPTHHSKLRIQHSTDLPKANWSDSAERWLESQRSFDDAQVRGWLQHLVPEYHPAGDLKSIAPSDQKALADEVRAVDEPNSGPTRLVLVAKDATEGASDTEPKKTGESP